MAVIASVSGWWRYDAAGSLHRGVAVALKRSEWLTLLVFVLALTLNAILVDEDVQRALGMCGGPLQIPCEEE